MPIFASAARIKAFNFLAQLKLIAAAAAAGGRQTDSRHCSDSRQLATCGIINPLLKAVAVAVAVANQK